MAGRLVSEPSCDPRRSQSSCSVGLGYDIRRGHFEWRLGIPHFLKTTEHVLRLAAVRELLGVSSLSRVFSARSVLPFLRRVLGTRFRLDIGLSLQMHSAHGLGLEREFWGQCQCSTEHRNWVTGHAVQMFSQCSSRLRC